MNQSIYSQAMRHYIKCRRIYGYSTKAAAASAIVWFAADPGEARRRMNRCKTDECSIPCKPYAAT